MKSFQDCMNDIRAKLGTGTKVQMTPQQLENMLRQFYEAGKANGGTSRNVHPFDNVSGLGDIFK